MKFACTQLSLSKALMTVDKAVSNRTTNPLLKGFLLNVKNQRLYITASDIDLTIETSIEVQTDSEGAVVVNAKLFEDIIRKLPSSIVKIEEIAGKLIISCLGSEFNIVTLPSDEFPGTGMANNIDKINLKREVFKNLIKKTSFAASIDEKKGTLTGCLMTLSNGSIEFAALDGFRLATAKAEINYNGPEKKIIIPARYLNEAAKVLSDNSSDDISIILDDKKLEIFIDETRMVIRLLEGEFIKYKDIIPKEFKTRLVVSCSDLLSSIERASLLAKEGKNNLIKFSIENNNIEITSRSEEGNVKENVSIDQSGEDIVIGFNSKYVIDVLKNCGDDEIAFEMNSAVSACLVKPTEGEDYIYMILPVRISAS